MSIAWNLSVSNVQGVDLIPDFVNFIRKSVDKHLKNHIAVIGVESVQFEIDRDHINPAFLSITDSACCDTVWSANVTHTIFRLRIVIRCAFTADPILPWESSLRISDQHEALRICSEGLVCSARVRSWIFETITQLVLRLDDITRRNCDVSVPPTMSQNIKDTKQHRVIRLRKEILAKIK